jgi:DNA integrity scanning protein DisA with diadenylate cyclase activity
MININNTKDVEVVEVAIGKKTYKIPLAKYLPYKAIKKMRNTKDVDAIIEILSTYIPMEVLDELTLQQITQIIEAWGGASTDEDDEENLGN